MKREREEQIIHDMKLAAVIFGSLYLVIEKWFF